MKENQYIQSLFSLEGHTGIVTGASRGMGMGIAKVLTDAGARVYNLDLLPRTEEEAITGFMEDIPVDLTCSSAVSEALQKILSKEGHLDFLINNAGITYKCRAEEFPAERYDKIQELNLKAVFDLSRICYPYLKESPYIGRIVNISSMGAYMGFTGVVPYCISKSGILGLTRGLAEEWKHDNIRVNSIAPGWVLTKMNEEMFAKNPDRKEAALNKSMIHRFGKPQEVGHMALFLLSQASNYLTGQDFAVDGGALSHGF